MKRTTNVLAVVLTCGAVLLSADALRFVGLSLYTEQYLAGLLAITMPLLFVFSGTLLMKGDPLSIALDFALAVAGIWFVSAAMMGYSGHTLGLIARVTYALIGICLLMPSITLDIGRWINLAGVAGAVGAFAWSRQQRTPA